MRETRIVLSLVCICALAFMSICFLYSCNSASATKPQVIPLPMPAGNIAPSRDFLADYKEYLALIDEIKELEKKDGIAAKRDQVQGMFVRLKAQVPKGYEWDEPTWSFKPEKLAPAPAPAPPAPTPTK